jgi:drug/metabolite transporter (DMT)-like permease
MQLAEARRVDAPDARSLALACAVLGNVVAGASYVLTKQALDGLGAQTVVVVRTVVALAALLPVAGPARVAAVLRARGRPRALLLAMGVLGYAVPLTLGNYGLQRSTATNAAMLIGLEPIGIAVLGALVLRERIGTRRAAALALGLLGALLIVGLGADPSPAGTMRVGDLLLALHAALWAVYTIAAKPLLRRVDATVLTTASLAVALPVVALAGGVELATTPRPAGPLLPALAAAAALGVLLSALMILLWNAALRRLDASQLAGFVFLQPVTGALLGVGLLGEPPGAPTLAGGALVLGGVLLLARDVPEREPAW